MNKSILIALLIAVLASIIIVIFVGNKKESYKIYNTPSFYYPKDEEEEYEEQDCCGCSQRLSSDLSECCRQPENVSTGRYPIDLPSPDEPKVPEICSRNNITKYLIQ